MYSMYCRVISRDRDVEDVEVLALDQVEQQIERALEGLEEDLERIGRYVEIVRQLGDGHPSTIAKGISACRGRFRLGVRVIGVGTGVILHVCCPCQ